MTIPSNTYTTYSVVGMKEDVQNFISNISPTDTPLQKMADTTKVGNRYFEWQTDALAAASGSNAQLEGDTITAAAQTATVRVGNTQQISSKAVEVSGSMEATQRYGRGNEMAYLLVKATKELRRDMEAVLTGAVAAATGSTTVARKTSGLECWITTNASHGSGGSTAGFSAAPGPAAPTDGTARALDETTLKSAILSTYTAGGEPSILMVPPKHKQVISSSFTGAATRMIEADGKKLVASVDVYVSDFGDLKIRPNRFQRYTSGSVNGCAFLLQPDLIKIAYLRPLFVKDLPAAADVAAFKAVICEYGLMVANEKGLGKVADLS